MEIIIISIIQIYISIGITIITIPSAKISRCCRSVVACALPVPGPPIRCPALGGIEQRKKWRISHVLQPAIEQPVVYTDPLILAFGDMIDTDWGRWKKYENMKLRINDQLCTSMCQLWFPTQSPTIF